MVFYGYVADSPKHLYMGARMKRVESMQAVRFYHGKQASFNDFEHQFNREMKLSLVTAEQSRVNQKMISFFDLCISQAPTLCSVLKTRHLRWPFLLCICAEMANRPVVIVVQYSTGMLQTLGIDQRVAALYTALIMQLPMVMRLLYTQNRVCYRSSRLS